MQPDEALWRAIAAADDQALAAALAAGADPDARREIEVVVDRDLRTYVESALHAAVRSGATQLVERLLAAGADPDARAARDDGPPFVVALATGRRDVAQLLLAAGCSCPPSALRMAASAGSVELLARCLQNGADLAAEALLPVAAQAGHVDVMHWLLDHGADLAREGDAALCAAVHGRQHAATRALLELGVDPDARAEFGWPALHFAAYAGDVGLMELLTGAGADPNALDDQGLDAQHWFGQGG